MIALADAGDRIGEAIAYARPLLMPTQQELPAAQQAADVGELGGMHPPDRHVQPVGGGDDPGPAAADGIDGEDLSKCQRHRSRRYMM